MSVTHPSFCPICGESLVERPIGGRERATCPSCGYIHFVNPVPGVGIIIEYQDQIVLVKRGGRIHTGRWALPSGYIEADESVEEAAIREAKEETGLDVELDEMLGVYSFPDGPPASGIIMVYTAKVVGGELRSGDDAIDVALFFPADLPQLPFRTHRQAMERWLQLHQEQANSTDEFVIRFAENSDAEAIVELLRSNLSDSDYEEMDWRGVSQRFRESSAVQVFVAETSKSQQIVGFVALSLVRTLTGGRGWIDDMVIKPSFADYDQVGVALLEAAMRHGRRLNLTHLFVNTGRGNEYTRQFYKVVGFRPSSINDLRIR
jgi:ADP-ribose pyrophosphatase YjhB (NUDIX family)/N-acetylglutamate synthase-like GNAT family acetyltransferase